VSGELGPSSIVARADGWAVETLGAEVVMLDPARDRYLRLNPTGSVLWNALEEPACPSELAGRLAEAEGIARDRAERDVLGFLNSMIEHGAVRIEASPEAR
jgi:hypothetical protein